MSKSAPVSRLQSRANSVGELAGVASYDLKSLNPGSIEIDVKGAFIVDDDDDLDGQAEGRTTPPGPDTRDIALPHHTAEVSHISVDIGGSLTKVVYFTREAGEKGGRLNFAKFETQQIDEFLQFLETLVNQRKGSKSPMKRIMATGGGSYKFYDIITKRIGVEVVREDEMEALISGLNFFITKIPGEVFCYSEANPMVYPERETIYPCLLVNIGSGVSMIKVHGPGVFTRVGGSSLGGGTLWGLLSMLTDCSSFDEMLDIADEGDNTGVDMLVGDIYGTDYARIGLKATTIASSFGKVFKQAKGVKDFNEKSKLFDHGDISRSLLYAISNNIGQIAYLQAQVNSVENIYFSGSFIRGHPQTMNALSYATRFWSKGEKNAYFLRHEGYLGAVGAFIKEQSSDWWDSVPPAVESDEEDDGNDTATLRSD